MERDDIIEYSLYTHHTDEEGKKKRKKLWMVFWILLVVTIVEVVLGFKFGRVENMKGILMITFIALTIVKAGYIVLTFMHLGDERSALRYSILVPFILFIVYLIWICVQEAIYIHEIREMFGQ